MPTTRRTRDEEGEVPTDSEGELVDMTAKLELRSRRTERKQKRAQKRLEKQALAPKVIMDLPSELLIEVFSLLRPSDVFALLRVNKPLHRFISHESDVIARRIVCWRYPCLERCFRPPALMADLGELERAAIQGLHAAGPSVAARGRTWRLRQGQLQHVAQPPKGLELCECVTCTLRWIGLAIAVDFAHWQNHLDRGLPIDVIKPGQAPAWNAELIARHAALIGKAVLSTCRGGGGGGGGGNKLWYTRILEQHLSSTIRSIRRHMANKGNRRNRFLLTDDDERAGTDAFLERSGPPTIDYPYHRDNYYMLEAYLPNRSWSGDEKRWLYVPAEQHLTDLGYVLANYTFLQHGTNVATRQGANRRP